MAHKVIMPKQGLQMTEGTIIKWLVREGEKCVQDEPLFDMETDKLTITIDAPASGTLLKIVKDDGETVPITEMIGVVGEEGEDISSLLAETALSAAPQETIQTVCASAENIPKKSFSQESAGAQILISPRAKKLAKEKGVDIACVLGSGPEGLIVEKDIAAFAAARPAASPLAKKEAQARGIDLATVKGTGSHGKIMRADLPAQAASDEKEDTVIPLKGMRKVIADKMSESLRVHAQLTHSVKADMTNAAKLRATYKNEDVKISFNDIVLKAVARALTEYPMMNSRSAEDAVILKKHVNLGVAVAVKNGLIVPNIKMAETLGLGAIGKKAREMAVKARENALTPDDYADGTFTVSNLGMFGLERFVAIINTPESGILAVGAIEKTPVVVNDSVEIRPMMSLTLTYDHRVVDGAPAAEFLVCVKKFIEHPCLML